MAETFVNLVTGATLLGADVQQTASKRGCALVAVTADPRQAWSLNFERA